MEEGLLQGGPDYVSLIADGEDWCVPCLPVLHARTCGGSAPGTPARPPAGTLAGSWQ